MKTIQSAVPPMAIGAAPAKPCGRYKWRPDPSAMDLPVRELTLTDIRVGLDCAHTDASNALRDRRYDDAAKYINDAKFLTRALRRFERELERERLDAMGGGK